jgi:hypothetical protein
MPREKKKGYILVAIDGFIYGLSITLIYCIRYGVIILFNKNFIIIGNVDVYGMLL